MNKILIISNRPLEGYEDGPQEVLDQYLNGKNYYFVNLKKELKTKKTLINFNFWFNFKLQYIIKKRTCNNFDEVVVFPYHSFMIFPLLFYKLKNKKIIIIGYDSFFRNYLLLQSRRIGYLNKIRNRILSFYFYLLEYLASKICSEILLVSKKCKKFSEIVYKSKIYNVININTLYIEKPKIVELRARIKKYDIIGPFISDYDAYDLSITIRKLKLMGACENDITLVGKGASKVQLDTIFNERIDWVDNFETFHKGRKNIAVLNKTLGAGVPTKVQKLVRLGRTVIIHKKIDVGVDYLKLVWRI